MTVFRVFKYVPSVLTSLIYAIHFDIEIRVVIRERTDVQAEHWSTLPAGQNRDSVRITSHALYSGGLFLIDLALMPWGCGVWPACEYRTVACPG